MSFTSSVIVERCPARTDPINIIIIIIITSRRRISQSWSRKRTHYNHNDTVRNKISRYTATRCIYVAPIESIAINQNAGQIASGVPARLVGGLTASARHARKILPYGINRILSLRTPSRPRPSTIPTPVTHTRNRPQQCS